MLLLHLKRVLFFGLLGLIGAALWVWLSKPIYEARLVMQVGDTSRRAPDPTIPEEVGKIIDKVESQQPATEVDILRQEGLFERALTTVSDKENDPELKKDWKDYFKMYTVLGGPNQFEQNPLTMSGLAVLAVRAYSAKTAIDLANAMGDEYTQTRQLNLRQANAAAENYLTNQIAYYAKLLKGLDQEYKKAKEETKIPDVQVVTVKREEAKESLQSRKQTTEAELDGSEQELASLQHAYALMPPTVRGATAQNRNGAIEALDVQLATARSERAAVARIYLDTAPEVKGLDDKVNALQAQRDAAMKTESVPSTSAQDPNAVRQNMVGQIANVQARVESAKAQLRDIDAQYAAQVAQVDALPAGELRITEIDRTRKVAEAKFQTLTAAHDVVENRANAAPSPALIISAPQPEFVKDPVEPNVPRTILIGVLAGLALGAIFTAARESIKPIVFSATQLEQTTGLPVVATMPRLPGGDVQRVRTMVNGSRFPRKNFHDMASVVLAERETLPKTVVVCGVDGEAGSTMAAVSYAAALARTGLRVTLVDANPSKILTRAFEMEAENGIVDYLTQAALISQKALAQFSMLTKYNEQLGCRICAYGTADTASLTDFSDDRVGGIIEALKPDCDVLLIETAPSGRLPDAVRMARHADEVLATFESGTSSDRSVETLRDLFAEAGVKKMSMVLTSTLERVA